MILLAFAIPIGFLGALSLWVWALVDSLREERSYWWIALLAFLAPVTVPVYLANFKVLDDPAGRWFHRRQLRQRAEFLQARIPDNEIIGEVEELAGIHFELGKWEECLRCLRKVIDFDAESLKAQYQAGRALSELGRHADAINLFEYVVEVKPDFHGWRALVELGNALAAVGRTDEAIAAYTRCLAKLRIPEAAFRRAQLRAGQGQHREARQDLESLLESFREHPEHFVRADKQWFEEAERLLATLPPQG